MKCDHDKSYSPNVLLSYPPQRQWICQKCMEEGTDVVGVLWKNDYDALKNLKGNSTTTSEKEL